MPLRRSTQLAAKPIPIAFWHQSDFWVKTNALRYEKPLARSLYGHTTWDEFLRAGVNVTSKELPSRIV
jgi:hypothetical protein